jgi:hypothetical protein
MELFKEISMLGFDFLKAKKGIRINKEEIEEAEKICINIGKKIDKTAEFVNKNQLADPIIRGISKASKIILFFCGFIFISAALILIFADSLITSLAIMIVVTLLCRFLLVISVIFFVIALFMGYTKIRN